MPITKQTATKLALMRGGSYGKGGDVIGAYMWDTTLFPDVAPAQMLFFRVPIGGQYLAGLKTLVETNLQQPGQFPASQNFLMEALKIDLILNNAHASTEKATLVSAFNTVIRHSVFTISIPNREYEWRNTGRVFMPTVSEAGPQAAANQLRMGDWNHRSWINIETPIPVGELITVTLTVDINSGDPTIRAIVTAALADLAADHSAMGVNVKGTLARSK